MARRVGREEAERLIHAHRPGAVVQQVRVGDVVRDVEFPAPYAARGQAAPRPTWEFAYGDGSVFQWRWAREEGLRTGHQLWCTFPDEDGDVVCIRAKTDLVEPLLLHAGRGTVELVRSRFGSHQEPVVDASVVAPADVTQGTGLSEEDAFTVLRSRHAAAVRRGRRTVGVSFLPLLPALEIVGPVGAAGGALGVAATIGVGLVPGVIAALWDAGPGRRRRETYARTYEGQVLEPVEVLEWRMAGVTVKTRDGWEFAWTVRSEYGTRMETGAKVWATPIRDGEQVYLVGLRDGSGPPVVVAPFEPARQLYPRRSAIQDVVPDQ